MRQIYCNQSQQILMRRQTKQEKGSEANPPQQHSIDTATTRVTLHFPSQLQHYEEDDSNSPVTIYLRSPSKKAIRVQLPAKISISEIKAMGEERLGIRRDRQLLHLNGKNVTEYSYIRLQPRNIIHIASTDDLIKPQHQITLTLKIIDAFRNNAVSNKQYTVSTTLPAGDLLDQIRREREEEAGETTGEKLYLYFLQSSRLLEREKSFCEQDLSKNTQIICLITKHELKTRFSNDTKEEILHDISELLGFEEEPAEKQPPKVERTRLRYPREERPRAEEKRVEVTEQPEEHNDTPSLSKTASLPSFKKKKELLSKTFSSDAPQRPLVTRLKASKSKQELQQLLHSQQKQSEVFELPQPIKEAAKEESRKEASQESKQGVKEEEQMKAGQVMEIHKPAPSIPKVMPVQERRKIRQEIDKLFDFMGGTGESREEEKPKSPPTEQPVPRPEKEQKMRFSMGSRPAFLEQLRLKTASLQ